MCGFFFCVFLFVGFGLFFDFDFEYFVVYYCDCFGDVEYGFVVGVVVVCDVVQDVDDFLLCVYVYGCGFLVQEFLFFDWDYFVGVDVVELQVYVVYYGFVFQVFMVVFWYFLIICFVDGLDGCVFFVCWGCVC